MKRSAFMLLYMFALSGCGTTVSQLPEIWDRSDPEATYDMETQVKRAIYCELKKGTDDIKRLKPIQRLDNRGRNIATDADGLLPDTWGILSQLTLQVDEKSSLTPSVAFKTPIHNAPVNFPGETIGATGALAAVTYGPLSVPQSYSLGFGGQLSSQNTRSDKYNTYYLAKQLKIGYPGQGVCRDDYLRNDHKSTSSPFLDASNLGLREWLKTAVQVINFERSSRASANGEGPPLGPSGANAPDSSTYDNKFIIISDGSITPTWNLVRIGTPTTPLFDASRTRTHELIMTLGPGAEPAKETKKGRPKIVSTGPTLDARDAFNAALIGAAVANAIRGSQ